MRSTLNWAVALGGAVVLLAWRGLWEDPQRPWWSAGATAAVALLASGLALGRRSQPFAYASTVCAAIAAAFVWTRPWLGVGIEPVPQHLVNLIEAPLLAVLAMSVLWLVVEVWWSRSGGSFAGESLWMWPLSRRRSITRERYLD